MKKLTTILALILIFAGAAGAQNPYFLSDPAPSPDGKTIVFCYEGDLWKLDRASGEALRMTAMQGYESAPHYSPDGLWLAFTGTQFGNPDVFVIPASGGEIKQITYHDASDEVEGWSWDSKEILFRSTRENSASVYRVPAEGGNPVRIFNHYFNVIHNLAIHPVSGEIFFNDTWESLRMTSRKRYRGQYDPDIQSYQPKTGEHKVYTEWDGKDMLTTIDQTGQVYFVSDQKTGQYTLFQLDQGKPVQLTNFKTSIYRPQVNAGGQIVVFEKDYQLWLYDVAAKKAAPVQVTIIRNTILPADQAYDVNGKISSFDISPDEKKIAFVSRGSLFVSDIKGKFVEQIKTGESFERVDEVHWLKDNKTLIFSKTWKGYYNWFTVSADLTGEVRQLTKDLRNNRALEMTDDRKTAAYLSGRDELRIMDLEDFKTTATIKDEFWGFQNGEIDFSPDGKWLLYTAKRDFENDVFAYELATKKSMNLTNTGISESSPMWGPEGKYLYLVTNRLNPSYPSGAGDVNLYKVALAQHDEAYRAAGFEELFSQDTTKKSKKDTLQPPIRINPDKIWERYTRIGPGFGSQGLYGIIKSKDKTTVLFGSNHNEGKWGLWKLETEPFETPKTEEITGLPGGASLLILKDKVWALSGGAVYGIDLGSKKATKIEIKYPFVQSMKEEFSQMFAQTWSNIEENFYHESLHDEDWSADRNYYEQFLPHLNTRDDFRRMMNDMLGELNSSHMGFTSGGPEEKGLLSYATLECGLEYTAIDPYKVSRVIPRGPADKDGIDILPGDRLIAVNGQEVSAQFPRDYYFYQPMREQEMELTFERSGKQVKVMIHPTSSCVVSGSYYEEWIDQNAARVKDLSKNTIAYAHMKNMGGGELNQFIMTMTRELPGKKGLILDLRYNTGGNVHDAVLRFLQQKTYLQWKAREGKLANQSNFAPSDYPIVLLINEQSLSDAEMTAAGFKALKLGTIIGTETYRWIIFTSGMGLVDGSFHRMPGWGCYTLDGKNLEQTGVQPDIYVPQTFTDRLNGVDHQIERAVQEILSGNGD